MVTVSNKNSKVYLRHTYSVLEYYRKTLSLFLLKTGAGSQFGNNESKNGEIVDLSEKEDEDLSNHEEEDNHLRENHSSRVFGKFHKLLSIL